MAQQPRDTKRSLWRYQEIPRDCSHLSKPHNISYITTYHIYHNTLWHMRRYPPQATGSPAVVQSHLDPKLPPRQHFHSSKSCEWGLSPYVQIQICASFSPNQNTLRQSKAESEARQTRANDRYSTSKANSVLPSTKHPLHLGIQINHTLRQERTDRMVFLHSWHSFQEGSSLEGESVLTFISFI